MRYKHLFSSCGSVLCGSSIGGSVASGSAIGGSVFDGSVLGHSVLGGWIQSSENYIKIIIEGLRKEMLHFL